MLYLNCGKTVLYILTTFITISERKQLLKEILNSPFTLVDENLTQELYNNILEQSKHPNDLKLRSEYNRLSIERILKAHKSTKNERKSNLTLPLDESSVSSGVVNKVGGSINFNPYKSNSQDITSIILFIPGPLLQGSGFDSPLPKD